MAATKDDVKKTAELKKALDNTKRALQAANESNKRLEATLQDTQNTSSKQGDAIKKLNDDLERANENIAALTAELKNRSESSTAADKAALSELKDRISHYEAVLRDAGTGLLDLDSDAKSLKDAIQKDEIPGTPAKPKAKRKETIEINEEVIRTNLADLKKMIEEMKGSIAQLKGNQKELSRAKRNVELELAKERDSKSNAEDKHREALENLAADKSAVTNELERKKAELRQLRAQNDDLVAKLMKADDAKSDEERRALAALKATIQGQTQRIKELDTANEEAQARATTLDQEVAALKRNHGIEIKRLTAELKAKGDSAAVPPGAAGASPAGAGTVTQDYHRSKIIALEQSQKGEVERLNARIIELEANENRLFAKIRALGARLAKLGFAIDEPIDLDKIVELLEKMLKEKEEREKENNLKDKALANARSAQENAEQVNGELKEQLEKLRGELAREKEQTSKLNGKLTEANSKLSELSGVLADKAIELANKSGDLANALKTVEGLKAEKDSLSKDLALAMGNIADKDAQIAALKAQLAKLGQFEQEMRKLEEERNKAVEAKIAAEKQVAVLKDQLGKAEASLGSSEAKVKELSAKVTGLEEEVKRLNGLLEAARNRIRELEAENAQLKAERDRLAGELKGTIEERNRAQAERDAARAQRDIAQAALAQAGNAVAAGGGAAPAAQPAPVAVAARVCGGGAWDRYKDRTGKNRIG